MTISYVKPEAPAAPVSLTKAQPRTSLTKQTGLLRVNLNWDAGVVPAVRPGGLFKRPARARGIDLDVGCLWELTDGSKGVVQALGNAFGDLDRAPFVQLQGDDRSGAVAGGEDLVVNLAHAAQIRRLLVFAFIYEGAASFDQANAIVTLTPPTGAPVEVRLDERAEGAPMCAIALLEGGSGGLAVRREVRYVHGGQSALDRAYGWGMSWSKGRK